MKKRTLVVFTLLPFIIGFLIARSNSSNNSNGNNLSFQTGNISANDTLTISVSGNIYAISNGSNNQITQNQNLIEPAPVNSNYIAIMKTTNYSDLLEFDKNGQQIKTLFNGNASIINNMSWITDPAVNQDQNKVAYVSDKNKKQLNAPDNALFVLDLTNGQSKMVEKPDPYSGGLAHPVWNPANSNILLYDYYQYDPKTLEPYSTIMEYNSDTNTTLPLTTDKQNAYQAAFSKNGSRLLFLVRNKNTLDVSLYIADFANDSLSNEHLLKTGDLAYPMFSNTEETIYYLETTGNTNYNLYSAKLNSNKLTNIQPVIEGNQLKATSSFTVSRNN